MSTFTVAELERRMANMIRIGTIASVDVDAARCRVKLGELITGDLPWLTAHAGETRSWAAPSVGEQVLVFSPFGDIAQGVVLPSLYQQAHAAPSADPAEQLSQFEDGAVTSYNSTTHRLSALLPAAGVVHLVAPDGITIEGDVTVTGDVIANGISLISHVHGGVTPGGATTSGPQ